MTYGIREIAEEAKRIGAIDLAQGIIDSPPPSPLTESLKNLPLEKYSTYNNKRGVPEYRESIVNYLKFRGWNVHLDQILGIAGVTAGLAAGLLSELKPGASVLLPEPFFIGHKLLLEALGFNIIYLETPVEGGPDYEMLESAMNKADAMILTTPANPSGYVVLPSDINKLTKLAKDTDKLLLIDEMYREFIWDEETPDDSEYNDFDLNNSIFLRSFSKTLSIPGWRVGFAVTSPERLEKMAATHDALYLGGSTLSQHAIADALATEMEGLNSYVVSLRDTLKSNREILAEAFSGIGMEPRLSPATYYMFIKHNRESDTVAVKELMDKKIAVTPANILFSDSSKESGYIRIHFAVKPEVAQKVKEILS